jgi:DNA-binding NarL/FixJ family response regulator
MEGEVVLASQPMVTSIRHVRRFESVSELRLFVADDHPLILDCIKSIFQVLDTMLEVTGFTAISALEEALELHPRPDLVLIDFQMPGLASLEAISVFIERHRDVRVAVISGQEGSQLARELIRCGCCGFVPKSLAPSAIHHAVRQMAGGGQFLPPFPIDSEAGSPPAGRVTAPGCHRLGLTRREVEVLRALADGSTNKQIARTLCIEEVTVKLHLRRGYAKLAVRNRIEAVRAIFQGVLDQT